MQREKDKPLQPWLKGTEDESTMEYTRFSFNKAKRGWHYGWASNKHTCNARHVMCAYVFTRSGDYMKCVAKFHSPPFMLFCRRRRRFTMAPTNVDVEAPSSKKKSTSPKKTKKPPKKKLKVEQSSTTIDENDVDFWDESYMKMLEYQTAKPPVGLSMPLVDAIMRRLVVAMEEIQPKSKPQVPAPLLAANTAHKALETSEDVDILLNFMENLDQFEDAVQVFPVGAGGMSPITLLPTTRTEEKASINALARFLVHESTFSQDVQVLLTSSSSNIPDYPTFLNIAKAHFEVYMAKHELAMADFQAMIGDKQVS